MRKLAVLAAMLAICGAARAEIVVLQCEFARMNMFITIYDDGTPARIGTMPGVGDRGTVIRDPRNEALIVIETNMDNLPVTLTTIQPDLQAVHSRHVIDLWGKLVAPSQARGACKRVAL